MLQLENKELPAAIVTVLTNLQKKVNDEPDFIAKAKKTQTLWGSKGGKKGKDAFEEIANTLSEMCVYVEVCNYCEQNEANDIEHIYPKSFFPSHAFEWSNYILACKQCNTAYKLDKCFVLNEEGEVFEVPRGTEPLHNTVAIINPRIEDPHHFMWLNMQTRKFNVNDDLSLNDYNKADKTLEILQLNERDLLVEDRKNTATYYYERMKTLAEIINADSVNRIQEILSPYDNYIDITTPLDELKEQLKESFKNHLTRFKHPSVWHSIKTIESQINPKWEILFASIPGSIEW